MTMTTDPDLIEAAKIFAMLAVMSVGVGFLFGFGVKIAERLWLYIVGIAVVTVLIIQGVVLIILGLARPSVFGRIEGLRRIKGGFVVIGTLKGERQDYDGD